MPYVLRADHGDVRDEGVKMNADVNVPGMVGGRVDVGRGEGV